MLRRFALVGTWLLCVALLGLWLAEAIHRQDAIGGWIVGTGLTSLVIIPTLAARAK